MEIVELLGKRALGRDRPEDYISWAEEQLVAGVDSENLPILASMDFAKPIDPVEVRECFRQVVTELGLDWPETEDCIKQYADIVCRQLVDGSMDCRTGVEILAGLYGASDYKEYLYLYWLYLDEDISLLDTEYGAIFNYGLTKANVGDYVKQVAEQHLRLSKIDLPKEFRADIGSSLHLSFGKELSGTKTPSRWKLDIQFLVDHHRP